MTNCTFIPGGTEIWVRCGCPAQIFYLNQFSNENKKGGIGISKPVRPKRHPIWAAHPRIHLSTKYPWDKSHTVIVFDPISWQLIRSRGADDSPKRGKKEKKEMGKRAKVIIISFVVLILVLVDLWGRPGGSRSTTQINIPRRESEKICTYLLASKV